MPYYIYILRCSDNTLYTGITTDIERRVRQHNGEVKGGARYTRAKRPVQLVHSEELQSRSEATKREYEIKALRREEKEALIG